MAPGGGDRGVRGPQPKAPPIPEPRFHPHGVRARFRPSHTLARSHPAPAPASAVVVAGVEQDSPEVRAYMGRADTGSAGDAETAVVLLIEAPAPGAPAAARLLGADTAFAGPGGPAPSALLSALVARLLS